MGAGVGLIDGCSSSLLHILRYSTRLQERLNISPVFRAGLGLGCFVFLYLNFYQVRDGAVELFQNQFSVATAGDHGDLG